MYLNGQGVKHDYPDAEWLFRKAADQGYALAQANLALLYMIGQGVPGDYVQAYKWISLAARALEGSDRDKAIKARDDVAARMTPAQIAEAQNLASEWKPP